VLAETSSGRCEGCARLWVLFSRGKALLCKSFGLVQPLYSQTLRSQASGRQLSAPRLRSLPSRRCQLLASNLEARRERSMQQAWVRLPERSCEGWPRSLSFFCPVPGDPLVHDLGCPASSPSLRKQFLRQGAHLVPGRGAGSSSLSLLPQRSGSGRMATPQGCGLRPLSGCALQGCQAASERVPSNIKQTPMIRGESPGPGSRCSHSSFRLV